MITDRTGAHHIFPDIAEFDLDLIGSRTFDDGIQWLTYRPTLHDN